MTIGQRIAQKRKELGLSQEALGAELGVSRQSIYKWESDAALPEIDKLIALSRRFAVSVGWLLGVEESPVPESGEHAEPTPSGELNETQLKMVEEIVGSAVLKFRKRYPDVEVAVRLPEDPLLVPMDGILIEQVLVNLMENSVLHGKHTSKVEVSAEEEKDRVVFYVDDDGAGIRPSALPKLFEGTFRQGDEESCDSRRNMGIGLSVCMSIIRAHQGDMKAENRKEGGARLSFWLPMERGTDQWR